jgi:hypothetical protein
MSFSWWDVPIWVVGTVGMSMVSYTLGWRAGKRDGT